MFKINDDINKDASRSKKKGVHKKGKKNTALKHFPTTLDTARLMLYELEVISAYIGTSAQYKSIGKVHGYLSPSKRGISQARK